MVQHFRAIGLLKCEGACIIPCRFAASCAALPFITYRSILQVDEELYGGHQTLLMEDLNIALALFLVSHDAWPIRPSNHEIATSDEQTQDMTSCSGYQSRFTQAYMSASL